MTRSLCPATPAPSSLLDAGDASQVATLKLNLAGTLCLRGGRDVEDISTRHSSWKSPRTILSLNWVDSCWRATSVTLMCCKWSILNSNAMLNRTSKHASEKQPHSNQAVTASMPNAFVKIWTMTIRYLVVFTSVAMRQTSEVSITAR